MALRLSTDRKTSPIVRRQASKDAPRVANTFGLPAGISCPGRTAFCKDCYAGRLENAYSSSARLVSDNWETLQKAGRSVPKLASLLRDVVAEWEIQASKVGADRIFRIHWDGDFYSIPYARAWARVIAEFPDVQFWAYTRTFPAVRELAHLSNLALYISVDQFNIGDAGEILETCPTVRAAFCADTTDNAKALAAKLDRVAVPCPENIGRIPLVMDASRRRTIPLKVGADGIGACAACRLCVVGRADVTFATTHK